MAAKPGELTSADRFFARCSVQRAGLALGILSTALGLAAPKLVYGGTWTHENGKGMYQYQRSLSMTQTAGATLTYAFSGSGLDLLGANDGSAKLEVSVDGKVTSASASTQACTDLYQTFALRGLSAGPHTVQLKLSSGKLVVDAVGIVR